MDIPALLPTHVYTAIVLGSRIEGDTTAVLAAIISVAWDQSNDVPHGES